ncbi:regulatory protein RecX [Peristeroidobacter agariperforans]|uniref:regulatory protein RecX n=1 Tax=Peristeroidobacter agariperforans TaxID=268404 RepID=UPI0013007241|nr:regulatory protein RecX [Peristeroidobacter agariperforans]
MFEAAGLPAADDEALTPEERAERAKKQDKEVEAAAVRLLSRREHSTEELKRKLASKGYPEANIATVLEKLGKKKWVSDERFAANYVHHHARRGQGPVRIRAELRQQGITDTQIQQEMAGGQQDWNGLAAEVRRRKFGAELPRSAAERAKQARFLQYRGFNSDQIRAALKFDPDLDDEPARD